MGRGSGPGRTKPISQESRVRSPDGQAPMPAHPEDSHGDRPYTLDRGPSVQTNPISVGLVRAVSIGSGMVYVVCHVMGCMKKRSQLAEGPGFRGQRPDTRLLTPDRWASSAAIDRACPRGYNRSVGVYCPAHGAQDLRREGFPAMPRREDG